MPQNFAGKQFIEMGARIGAAITEHEEGGVPLSHTIQRRRDQLPRANMQKYDRIAHEGPGYGETYGPPLEARGKLKGIQRGR